MRIISKIHDYWDGALKHSANGIDKSITFVRNQVDHNETNKKDWPRPPEFDFDDHKRVYFHVVGFCGICYPYASVLKSIYENGLHTHNIVHFYYDVGELVEFLRGSKVKWSSGTKDLAKVTSYWNSVPKYYANFDLFRKHNCAYFNIDNYNRYENEFRVQTYPILRDIGFPKIKSVEQAYQDVELFITNVLAPKDDPYIAPVPDKIKAQSKGFDEFSFRKMKTKRK